MDSLPDLCKTCTGCGQSKLLSEFHKQRGGKHGVDSRCKECRVFYNLHGFFPSCPWRSSIYRRCTDCDEVKLLEDFHKDTCFQGRSYNCKTCRLKTIQARRLADVEVARAKGRAKYAANPEARRESSRRWRKNNPEQRAESFRVWSQANPEKARARVRRRRAMRKAAEGTHTAEDVLQILEDQKHTCFWCFSDLNGLYHVDHFIPLSRGGGDGPENIVIACPNCNQRRYNKLPWEFMPERFRKET